MVSRSSGYLIDKAIMKTNHSFSYQQGLFGDATSHSFPFGQGGYSTNGSFSMYFYLPDKNDGLEDLVKTMASTSGFLNCHTPRCKVLVNEFRIPKFKIEFGFEPSKALNELELESVELHHKDLVEIDEDGAEAAAVTIKGGRRGRRGYSTVRLIDFVADITRTVMFVGQIFDPTKTSSA